MRADWQCKRRVCIHLGVKEAGRGLDNANSLIVDGDGEEVVLAVLQDGNQLEAEVAGMKLGGEAVRNGLLLASGDLNHVALGSQVAHNLALATDLLNQGASNHGDADGGRFIVGDGEPGLGSVAVDELHTKDLGLGEGDGDGDLEIGSLGNFIALDDLLNLQHTIVSKLKLGRKHASKL